MPILYRKKPVTVEVEIFDGTPESQDRIVEWVDSNGGSASRAFLKKAWNDLHPDLVVKIGTQAGIETVQAGEGVVRDGGRFKVVTATGLTAEYEPA